jgi:hypothetical protein
LAFAEPSLASTTSPEPKVPGSFFCSAGGRKWPDRKPPPLPPAASVVRGRPAAGASVPIRRSCDGFRMPANADLSTGTRAGVRKPPKNETARSRAPGGSAGSMGNWLAPLLEHGPEDVAPLTSAVTGTAGSFALMNKAGLELGAADSENINFAAGASGILKLDMSAQVTGNISGLTPKDAVDLADLAWVAGHMKATFAGNASGGVLTVTNGTNSINLNLLGNYTQATWKLSKDGSGGTRVVDPPADGSNSPLPAGEAAGQIDLSSFNADSSLGYSADIDHIGGTSTAGDGPHAFGLALLGQYAAASFARGSDGHGGTLIADPPPNQQPLLAQPHP